MDKYLKLFFLRIVKDLKQKELLPLKLLFFMHSSTILVLYPYLTIHMRELGINVEETAIMSAVTPAVAILMPPIAGMIADKIGNFRVLLSAFSLIGGGSALLLLLVPAGRVTLSFPDKVIFGLSCEQHEGPMLSLSQEFPCKPLDSDSIFEAELNLEACGVSCQVPLKDNFTQMILTAGSYDVEEFDVKTGHVPLRTYQSENVVVEDERLTKKLRNNELYAKSIRRLSKHTYFFPTDLMYTFLCQNTSCVLSRRSQLSGTESNKAGLKLQVIEHEDFEEGRQLYKVEYLGSSERHNLTCTQDSPNIALSVDINIDTNETDIKNVKLTTCSPRCLATSQRKHVCSNSKMTIELDTNLTFWSYLCIRVFVGIISGTSFAMFEGAVIAILREHKADYGLQRIYATIGGMISSPISGWMIDYASRGKGYTDFRPIFYLYAALKIISGLLMLFINLEFKKAASSVINDVLNVLKKLEMIALFLSCIVLGCAWGFIESFLFWLLDDLGASKSLMGLTVTVGGLVGIPLLVLSGPIVKRIGHANVIFIGFVFYAIRLLGYSLLYNPWLCLMFEAMESITFGLSFTAAVTYAAKLSTVTTDTSIQGMLGGLYYGVGKGVGSLVGGYLIKPIGIRHTFQLFSGSTLLIGILYFGFYHFYMKHHPSQGIDITKKDTPGEQKRSRETELAMGYEDGVCNPAYETTDTDDEGGSANTVVQTGTNGQV